MKNLLSLLLLTIFPQLCFSQLGCNSIPPASDFRIEEIASAPGWPYDIVVDKDLKVYWVERLGAFRMWDPATKNVTLIKQFDVLGSNYAGFNDVETGLQGLAFDLDFINTHWVYIWYTPNIPKGSATKGALGPYERLSRFTLKNKNTEVDMTTEKILFQHQTFAQCCHFGGDLKMSKAGLLYLSTGDNIDYHYTGTDIDRAFDETIINGDPRNTSANTNDTRGKVLRIKPIPFPDSETPAVGIGTTYTIPAGNLKEVWNTTEKDKVRSEIFSMGHRNPFTIAVHPDKPWVAVGEANGDNSTGDDEINLITKPSNFGWPFLVGDNALYVPSFWTTRTDAPKNPASYSNQSQWNTGAKILPPATGSIISSRHGKTNMELNCFGVTWGWVDYDPASTSKIKWPPYLKGKLLVSSYGYAEVRVATIDSLGNVTKLEPFMSDTDVLRTTQGPDGAFYVTHGDNMGFNLDESCRITKVSYIGACSTVSNLAAQNLKKNIFPKNITFANLGGSLIHWPDGANRIRVFNNQGKRILDERRKNTGVDFSERQLPLGIYSLQFRAD